MEYTLHIYCSFEDSSNFLTGGPNEMLFKANSRMGHLLFGCLEAGGNVTFNHGYKRTPWEVEIA